MIDDTITSIKIFRDLNIKYNVDIIINKAYSIADLEILYPEIEDVFIKFDQEWNMEAKKVMNHKQTESTV